MLIRSFILALLFAGCATTGSQLTPLEKEKLDPALQHLVLGVPPTRAEYDITPGPTGEDKFGIVARTDNIDELRNSGIDVTSAFGDVAVVRVTIVQIRALVLLPSVKSLRNTSKVHTQ